MFNVIVAYDSTAWETDQLMRMDSERFGEYSGQEADKLEAKASHSLSTLENSPTLLMYEIGSDASNRDSIRYGRVHDITVSRGEITFRFVQEGIFTRAVVEEFGKRLGMGRFEWSRTHWAVKDGGIPSAMMSQLEPSNAVVPQTINFFISHASEDKAKFVRPLAKALQTAEYRVWYDEFELTVGDRLLDKIDEGLKQADYGIVVLSKSFFAKEWTQRELDGLFALEKKNKKLILPVWLNVTKAEVENYSPIIAGRLAAHGDLGVPHVFDEIERAISISGRTKEVAATAGRSALQALTRRLDSQESEAAKLDSYEGSDLVSNAAERLVNELTREIERENQGLRKRFRVHQQMAGAVTIGGPSGILLVTALRDIYVNSGHKAEFTVRYGQGSIVAPHPNNVETLEDISYQPRIVDDEGVKWEEKNGSKRVMSNQETAGHILERFVHHINQAIGRKP